MDLQSIGADARIGSLFLPYSRRGLLPGRVFFAHRGAYRLYTAEGEILASLAGALLFETDDPANLPTAGDWVAARIADSGHCVIEAVLPRRNSLARRAAGSREDRQIIAANLDLVFLVSGLDHDFNLRRLERYLTLARESQVDPVVVLNKADLCEDLPARLDETRRIARNVPVVSTVATEPHGLDAILPFLVPGRTVAVIGSSGAGKSTILNRLLGSERQATRETRFSDSRGRHTTAFRELVPLSNGSVLIDTPGMREIQLWASEENLDAAFEDVAELAARCRFRDCSHQSEPDCAVRQALSDGALDPARWQNYLKLHAEIRHHEQRSSQHAALIEKRRAKQACKTLREHYKQRR